MLNRSTIFYNQNTTPQTIIDLTIDNNGVIEDKDDACLKAIVEGFDMGDVRFTGMLAQHIYLSGPQAILYLKNMDTILLKITAINGGQVPAQLDKEFTLTACAAESMARKLFQTGHVKHDSVIFQCRYPNGYLSSLVPLIINPVASIPKSTKFQEDTISNAYAYLGEKRLCLFFNNISAEVAVAFKNIFASQFKEMHPIALITAESESTNQALTVRRKGR